MTDIDISGLDKVDVLRKLYDAAKPLGLDILHFDPAPMTEEEARSLLDQYNYFDYVHGRVMRVEIEGDSLDPRLYDRDNGPGAAAAALAA
jgi:hypothetical protein